MSGRKPNSAKVAEIEDVTLKFKESNVRPSKPSASASSMDDRQGRTRHDVQAHSAMVETHTRPGARVEMQTLALGKECENLAYDTIKHIHGPDFVLKDRSLYRDRGGNLATQYWINSGTLQVQGSVDYSNKQANSAQDQIKLFAVDKLVGSGFTCILCLPQPIRLIATFRGDVGSALELLASRYFKMGLKFDLAFPPKHCTVESPPKHSDQEREAILLTREEEKESLAAIYEGAFKEKIANRVWVLELELDYLLELFMEPGSRLGGPTVNGDWDSRSNSKPKTVKKDFCKFYAKGQCKFSYNCRFSHESPGVIPKTEEKERYLFELEVRFPQDSQYPRECPVVFLKTNALFVPPSALIHVGYRLVQEARTIVGDNSQGCVFDLENLLKYNTDEIKAVALGKLEAFPDPAESLFPPPLSEEITSVQETNTQGKERQTTTRAPRAEVSLDALQREDVSLARKFREKKNLPRYNNFCDKRRELPAWGKMQEIVRTVADNQVVVISGETGCGKSTQVPQFLLDDWLLSYNPQNRRHVEIVCTQPRRLSAIGVAERVADERAERVGQSVGYQIRLESKISSMTRLTFCTTGILLRRLEGDPHLSMVSHIIVDEVHERSEESDFLLLILKDLLPVRPDLKVILMSATLNADLFSEYFNKVPTLHIEGRTFPVTQLFLEDILESTGYVLEEYSKYARRFTKKDLSSLETILELADVQTAESVVNPRTNDEDLNIAQMCNRYGDYSKQTCKTLFMMDVVDETFKINNDLIEDILVWIIEGDHEFSRKGAILVIRQVHEGDPIVFLPGLAEILSLHDHLQSNNVLGAQNGSVMLVPLHSTLTSEEQAMVFHKPKSGVRKIVLSTNIAETSITIDDCVFVIDTGRMKEKRFDSNKNMESLESVWVSRANAQQRKGRAGRVMPGVCIHLYTSHRYYSRILAQPIPELHRVPLEQLLLRIKTLPRFANKDVHDVLGGTIEPPCDENIDSALVRLQLVGALNVEKELTPLGRHLASLPVDVRLGKLMLFGAIFCCVDSALTIAACLSHRSPFVSPIGHRDLADAKKKQMAVSNSDHLTMLEAYKRWRAERVRSRYAGKNYAQVNFLSDKTLVAMADIKHQFLELLASIGFIHLTHRSRRSGEDKVCQMVAEELNSNNSNNRILAAILCAALYPNVVKVLTPERFFAASVGGAVPREHRSDEMKFKTKLDGYVFLHPSSVNFDQTYFQSPYLVYQEKHKTSKVFIKDSTMVPLLPFILFSGCDLHVELNQGRFVLALDDGWIMVAVESQRVAELLRLIREELIKILAEKIKDPTLDLSTDDRSKKVYLASFLVLRISRATVSICWSQELLYQSADLKSYCINLLISRATVSICWSQELPYQSAGLKSYRINLLVSRATVSICWSQELLYQSADIKSYCINLQISRATVSICRSQELLYQSADLKSYCINLQISRATVSICRSQELLYQSLWVSRAAVSIYVGLKSYCINLCGSQELLYQSLWVSRATVSISVGLKSYCINMRVSRATVSICGSQELLLSIAIKF
uniref:RNA helicase n=2 Tax=Timema TaxID=61471 RepID=A0A7R9ILV7_9NEOP|nr:unnamed protein product [Timema tahoe]